MKWRTKSKQEWIENADHVEIVNAAELANHPNKWIRRLAPAVIKVYGFYVYFEGGKTYLLLPAESKGGEYQIFQTA